MRDPANAQLQLPAPKTIKEERRKLLAKLTKGHRIESNKSIRTRRETINQNLLIYSMSFLSFFGKFFSNTQVNIFLIKEMGKIINKIHTV